MIIKGWVPKSCLEDNNFYTGIKNSGELRCYKEKGHATEWHPDDWPPIPVLVFEQSEIEEIKASLHLAQNLSSHPSMIIGIEKALKILGGRK